MPVKEYTGKERMLIDWMSVRHSILIASSGEMKIDYKKDSDGKTIGIIVNMDLDFGRAVPMEILDDEKAVIDEAKRLKAEQPKL